MGLADGHEFRFRIDVYTPETLPMARLAEYMADLARLLGEPESVHFVRPDPGSADLVHVVDEPSVPKVTERVTQVRNRDAPDDVMAVYERLDRRLRSDNSAGHLYSDGAEIIHFPGKNAEVSVTFGPFYQRTTLHGVVMRLGGMADFARVTIHDRGKTYTDCRTKRDVVRALAPHIYGPELRFFGRARWQRDKAGRWTMDRFFINNFDEVDQEPLTSVVAKLRDVPGNHWREIDDPWRELDRIRYGEPEAD